MTEVLEKLSEYKRTAWVPETIEGDGSPTDTKFAGAPWLHPDEPWPPCGNCGKPMQLFVQINLDDLPHDAHGRYGTGLIQLFYCINEDPQCDMETEANVPFAGSVVARRVQPTGPIQTRNVPQTASAFPPRLVTGWVAVDDYPIPWESRQLSRMLTDDEFDEIMGAGYPHEGDKLAGWPYWVQNPEYPNCPLCETSMHYVFQIGSEDNLPIMFGDDGIGHLTQCPEHHNVLAFAWACH